jgi:predicted proteasome-type protease
MEHHFPLESLLTESLLSLEHSTLSDRTVKLPLRVELLMANPLDLPHTSQLMIRENHFHLELVPMANLLLQERVPME